MNTDNISPGPRRWERAVNAALAKPDTYHAKLLFERLNRVRDLFPKGAEFWAVRAYERNRYYCSNFCAALASHLDAHVGRNAHWSSHDELIKEITKARLDTKIFIGMVRPTWRDARYMERIWAGDLPRAVKCFACGDKMTRDGSEGQPLVDFGPALIAAANYRNSQTEEKDETEHALEDWELELLRGAPELAEPEKVSVILAPNGNLVVSVPEYRTVSLTERERVILGYVPAHFRHEVADRLEQL